MYTCIHICVYYYYLGQGARWKEREEVIIVIIFFSSLASRVSHYKSGYTIENNNFCFFFKTRRFFYSVFTITWYPLDGRLQFPFRTKHKSTDWVSLYLFLTADFALNPVTAIGPLRDQKHAVHLFTNIKLIPIIVFE